MMTDLDWPYLSAFIRLILALGLGLFVGLERERRDKEAGLRTFGLAALMGAVGSMLGDPFALLSFVLLGVLIVLLNVQSLLNDQKTELTTSVAFLLTGLVGVLCGLGHTLTPTAIAIITAALLAWKRYLSKITLGLTEKELRSAILLAILAFVVYPALPKGTIDKWGVIEPRSIWIIVIIIAGIGFVNYILWKLYGKRGMKLASFFGGFVNSTVTVHNLAEKVQKSESHMHRSVLQSIMLADTAMLTRNAVLLLILAPQLLLGSLLSFAAMIFGYVGMIFIYGKFQKSAEEPDQLDLKLKSPFSLFSTLRFAFILLVLQVAGIVAQRTLGQSAFFGVSFLGGLFSSASVIAATSEIFHQGAITINPGVISAVISSIASLIIDWILSLKTHDRQIIKQLGLVIVSIIILGIAGLLIQIIFL